MLRTALWVTKWSTYCEEPLLARLTLFAATRKAASAVAKVVRVHALGFAPLRVAIPIPGTTNSRKRGVSFEAA
jgi:hypothetical protein